MRPGRPPAQRNPAAETTAEAEAMAEAEPPAAIALPVQGPVMLAGRPQESFFRRLSLTRAATSHRSVVIVVRWGGPAWEGTCPLCTRPILRTARLLALPQPCPPAAHRPVGRGAVLAHHVLAGRAVAAGAQRGRCGQHCLAAPAPRARLGLARAALRPAGPLLLRWVQALPLHPPSPVPLPLPPRKRLPTSQLLRPGPCIHAPQTRWHSFSRLQGWGSAGA